MESKDRSIGVSNEAQSQKVKPAICVLLENYPAPFDRRVWQESRALSEAGYRVSIISPKALGLNASYEKIDGIEIHRHRTWEANRPLGYMVEYVWALLCEFILALKVYRRTKFRLIHACNPPDNSFLIGILFKLLGVRFVFDHHDLCPELFEDKFHRRGFLYRLVCFFEYLTFRTADVSIATNQSYREIAITRGKMQPERVFVVRSCLDLSKLHRVPAKPELKKGKKHLVVYLGVMGPQDGVDLLLESISVLVHKNQRSDTHFVLIGSGTETPHLKVLASEKGLDPFIQFTGRIPDAELEDYLSTADVAVAPDPANSLNDKSTMNKILHYMSYGLPIVQFDLTEGRRSAEGAALYARNDDPKEFAEQVARLLDDEGLREQLGSLGRRRIEEQLNWNIEKKELLRAYECALAPKQSVTSRTGALLPADHVAASSSLAGK